MNTSDTFSRPAKGYQRLILVAAAGGYGRELARRVEPLVADIPAIGFIYLDTDRPKDLPTTKFFEIRPGDLPEEPDGQLAALVRETGLSADEYRVYRRFVGRTGIVQIPAFSHLAAMWNFDGLARACESGLARLAARVSGAPETYLATISSGAGGTGTAASRCLGLASRTVSGGDNHVWKHFLIASSLLPPAEVTRRKRALEHRQMLELSSLMRTDAAVRVPGRQTPVYRPGPDSICLLASSPAAPRTLDDVAQELADVFRNTATR